jgi:carboxylesterase type B
MRYIIGLLALGLSFQAAALKVEGGVIEGTPGKHAAVIAYKGIPYAAPPLGDLRWKAPQPVVRWQGTKHAVEFSNSCIQITGAFNKPWTAEFMVHNVISEDCLYLNVWTPAKPSTGKLPVFVYIYGGGFREGSTEVPAYDGEGLAANDVIVVSMNYRLGVFGFLAHPELTAESGHGSSGNYGMLDQIAALKWIQHNITAFGGDPGRVTIAGQSAGSMAVHALVASPLAKGLFHRAIAQSSGTSAVTVGGMTTTLFRSLGESEIYGKTFVDAKGVTSLAQLRELHWEKIVALLPGEKPGPGMRFAPVIDGYFLTEQPFAALQHGKFNDVPMLTGNALNEIQFGVSGGQRPSSITDYRARIESRWSGTAADILKMYPAQSDEDAKRAWGASGRDSAMVNLYLWSRQRAQSAKSKTFIYLWDHTVPGPDADIYGAFHTSDVLYTMNTLYSSARPFTDEDRKIAGIMSSYWANFARTGDPNGSGLPAWPPTGTKQEVMELGERFMPIPLTDSAEKTAWFAQVMGN